ncbi:MAG: rhodanese-like domain-containing protein [Hydrogenophaga sp.]|uniref:rhodanese-like domain-containing protein n=1 Tax=Hydrogenophaga sp. TaxID=1904254 RepID=UPI00271801DF|nr:rhodanese-like domain-containing protein [Hydrogenophaga sp.]MDO9481083.1 rhodanese-like domain-containing protein [Hydrogenophaga sp.]MDP2094922.1 rhodanese-like domain-containing protein [Hydrogenophaga sp.]MDP3344701.1 rhodanese-like domain-containing protein [Hydrogenophaga sp.]MDP3808091.1 rhodanese-like domain-containing protein [Hydrogenophaga sp.]MDP3924282.1 rhodanese-like domain-containing protein [Hydrogenophaga sp.]
MLEEAKQVCPTTTQRLVREGALLLDVREPSEVAALAFDVPDLVNIPLMALEQRWSELPKDRDTVLVCENGARSLKATYFLQFHGFDRVSNMEGGILKWMSKGFPVIGQRHQAPAASPGCCGGNAVAVSCCAPAVPAADTGCCGSTADAAAPTRTGCC